MNVEEGSALGPRRQAAGWALAVAGVAGLTALLVPHGSGPTPTYQAMLYLAVAVACALVGGRRPALGASALGFLALNYYFTAPLHTLNVTSRLSVVTLVTFVLVSVAVSAVVDAAARRRDLAARAGQEAFTLGLLNERILRGTDDVAHLLDLARQTFGATSAELAPGPEVVLHGVSLTPADERVLRAFAVHLGVLQEREELDRQSAAARELEAGNRTRTALLAAVSHDLRTPLAGIRAGVETLRRSDEALSPSDRAVLLGTIEESTERLSTILVDLLDMSRLQTGAVQPVLTDVRIGDLVADVVAGLPGRDRVRVDVPLPVAHADAGLLARVLENVVANALQHTDGPVEVSGSVEDNRARTVVSDHGPGVPVERQHQMFEPFQRMGDAPGKDGVGLGLAVARGLVEAQGGRLLVEDTPGGGLTLVIETAAA